MKRSYSRRGPVAQRVQQGTRKRVRGVRIVAAQRGFVRQAGYYARFQGRRAKETGELKFFDLDFDDAIVVSGGEIQDSLNKIPQGVTEKTRVGRKCTVKKIALRYNWTLPEQENVGTPTAGDVLRIIIYVDKQCNGATAAVTDILESADYQSYNNLANSGRFRTLMDHTIYTHYDSLGSDAAAVWGMCEVTGGGDFYKDVTIPIEFDAATGAITEIRSNNIGMMYISKQGIIGVEAKIRIRFSDY